MSTISGVDTAQFKGIAPGTDSLDAEALADELGARFSAAREACCPKIAVFARLGIVAA